MGEVWVFELMIDKSFPESPMYVLVDPDNQVIDVFPSKQIENALTGIREPTTHTFNLLNEIFPCKD